MPSNTLIHFAPKGLGKGTACGKVDVRSLSMYTRSVTCPRCKETDEYKVAELRIINHALPRLKVLTARSARLLEGSFEAWVSKNPQAEVLHISLTAGPDVANLAIVWRS